MPSHLLFCCIYIYAWCVTRYPRLEDILDIHTMIPEVLVLGLLVCKIKIPCSSCIRARYDEMSKL